MKNNFSLDAFHVFWSRVGEGAYHGLEGEKSAKAGCVRLFGLDVIWMLLCG
jgi:hypothetical protein